MQRLLAAMFSVALMACFMAGCASLREVQSDVTAFTHWSAAPPGPGTTYRFERLPSQQAIGAPQEQIEALARSALAQVGLALDPAVARFSVQVALDTQRMPSVSADGYGYGYGYGGWARPGLLIEGGSRGASLGLSFPMDFSSPPYYRRSLTLLMRDLASGQIVFETHALSDGVDADTLAVLPAMLNAALRGFPQPVAGTRRIHVQTPR